MKDIYTNIQLIEAKGAVFAILSGLIVGGYGDEFHEFFKVLPMVLILSNIP